MSLKNINPLLLLCGIFFLAACADEEILPVTMEPDPEETASYTGVDEGLWVYFARFEAEGRARGIDIDLREEQITGMIHDLNEEDVAGQCRYSTQQPNRLVIDQAFWEDASDLYREFVVFHELGHCALGRDHRDAAFPNGVCRSLMRSGLGDCRDNFRRETRDTYLDELFDPQFYDELGIF